MESTPTRWMRDTLSADIGGQFSPADGEPTFDLAQIYPEALREPVGVCATPQPFRIQFLAKGSLDGFEGVPRCDFPHAGERLRLKRP